MICLYLIQKMKNVDQYLSTKVQFILKSCWAKDVGTTLIAITLA